MDIFALASWGLALLIAVSGVFPVSIPLLALSYKVRNGSAPIPLETDSFWYRSGFAALGLFLLAVVAVVLNYEFVSQMAFPTGTAHLALLMVYVPAAVVYLFWMYAMDDMFEGLSLFVLHIVMWGLLLALLDRVSPWKVVHYAFALLQPMGS
jgi:hypothetical protein